MPHTSTLTAYSAGGAGVLPGGGMLSKILTLPHADGLNCRTFLISNSGIRYPSGAGVGQGAGKGLLNSQ